MVSMMVRRVVNLMGVSISPIITVKLPCEGMRCGGREGREGGRKGREGGRGGREKSVIATAHSYGANLRSSPKLTELYSDTKNVFSRNPRMITAPIQN